MKKILLILVVFFAGLEVLAQQDALFSQYMFNPLIVNPGYAGSREVLSTNIIHRSQWLGFEGAPSTQSVSIHAPLRKNKIAIGGLILNDRIGPVSTIGAFGVYNYKLKLLRGKLSLGLKGGMYHFRFDTNAIDYQDVDDPLNNGILTSTIPSFDFGTYYYTKKFYAGLTLSHLARESINLKVNNLETQTFLRRHLTATVGKAIPTKNEKIVLRPSVFLRMVGTDIINVDANFSVLFNKRLWLGASVRSSKNLVLITEIYATKMLRIGYSYDITFSALRNYSAGSHELFIGLDTELLRKRANSVRYF